MNSKTQARELADQIWGEARKIVALLHSGLQMECLRNMAYGDELDHLQALLEMARDSALTISERAGMIETVENKRKLEPLGQPFRKDRYFRDELIQLIGASDADTQALNEGVIDASGMIYPSALPEVLRLRLALAEHRASDNVVPLRRNDG